MGFPQYSNIDKTIQSTITSRIGNNLMVSQLSPWIRISSAWDGGLVMESNVNSDSFSTRYGTSTSGGSIGRKFNGTLVQENTSDRGYRPSPVIEGLVVKNGAQGLTRKCSFVIKCFTLGQMETVSKYFLEPRFFALIEWGWNTADSYGSMATLKDDGICEMIDYQNLSVLKEKRSKSNGHYDAFLGVVAGGGFEYGEDETYNLNIEIVTQGEIPSYLQLHKGVVIRDENGGVASSKPFLPTDLSDAEEQKKIGTLLFMQMYNDLPGGKQITRVKQMASNPRWADPINFINMDKEISKALINDIGDGATKLLNRPNGSDTAQVVGKIVTDAQVVSNERFIRMDLAWEILHTTSMDIQVLKTPCKSANETINYRINIDNTICRAHKHIFSTDKSKLYIPNKNLPDFGLFESFFPPDSEQVKSAIAAGFGTEEYENTSIYKKFGTGMNSVDGLDFKTGKTPEPWQYFPSTIPLNDPDQGVFDDTSYSREANAHEWGYLKYLYINFDFFCECLEKNGYLAKDVALDILNGISSAVNMYWDFQISERGRVPVKHDTFTLGSNQNVKTKEEMSKQPVYGDFLKPEEFGADYNKKQGTSKGPLELQVVDFNFAGIPPKVGTPLMKFQSRGLNSPFISFTFNVDVTGAMANQIMAKRNAQAYGGGKTVGTTTAPEDKSESFSGLFADRPDPIMKVLDSLSLQMEVDQSEESGSISYKSEKDQKKELASASLKTAAATGNASIFAIGVVSAVSSFFASDDTEEIHEANFDYFLSKAGVFPKVFNRTTFEVPNRATTAKSNLGLLDMVFCGTFADSNLLTQVQEYDLCTDQLFTTAEKNLKNNPGFLPIKMTFTLHGVGGLKVGDIFSVIDLPHVYKTKLFQIMHVEQTVSEGMWVTQVDASLRNADVTSTDEINKLTQNG